MIRRIREWWHHLGYCWNKQRGEFRTFGLRPWRGAPFFWFAIDTSNTATQSDAHVAECEECRAQHVPTPKESEPHE